MTWTNNPMATGLSGDVLMEHLIGAGSDVTLSSNLIQFPTGTNNKKCLVLALIQGGSVVPTIANVIGALSAKVAISANPSAEINLLTDGTQATTHSVLRIGTDGRLKVYNDSGTFVGSSASTVSTNSASPTEFILFIDALTLSTVWISLVVNGVEELSVNTGQSRTAFNASGTAYVNFGDYTPAGSNRGATMTASMICARNTGTAGDAPHLTPYPRLLGAAVNPATSEGDSAQWTNGTTATPNTWKDVSDDGPHDTGVATAVSATTLTDANRNAFGNMVGLVFTMGGVTLTCTSNTNTVITGTGGWSGATPAAGTYTYSAEDRISDIQTTDPKTAHDHLFHYSAANPLSGTETIDFVQTKHVGKLNGSGKNYCRALIKLAGSTADANLLVTPGLTSYVGCATIYNTTPAGGSWAPSDFDLSAGVSKLQWGARSLVGAGVDTGADITMYRSPSAVYHTATVTTGRPIITVDRKQIFVTREQPVRKGWHFTSMAPPAGAVTPVTPNRRRWVWVS